MPPCCCVPPSSSSFFSTRSFSHTWVIATSCMYIVHVPSRYPSRLLPTKSQFDSVLSKLFFRLVTKIDEAAMTVRFIQITRKSQRYLLRAATDGLTSMCAVCTLRLTAVHLQCKCTPRRLLLFSRPSSICFYQKKQS